ncbi:MAG TPA: nucleotidyl transferase AbiEii/AbiGii toxin family protein [Anaerolineae bacterium]|nr:nucleotidyl transferase AbiEii/AbiGii toxin family protein [Anaerolineae bacterium]
MPKWEIFKEAAERLESVGIDFMLCGGIAVWVYGRRRETTDVDFLVRERDVNEALEALKESDFDIKRTDLRWLYQAFKDDTKVDLIFEAMGAVRLTSEVEAHAQARELFGYTYKVISPEDLIIMKAHSMSEERPRDWYDALSVLKGTDGQLDWEYLIKRSRPRLRRMLGLLFFAQSEAGASTYVPDWVIHRLLDYLPD